MTDFMKLTLDDDWERKSIKGYYWGNEYHSIETNNDFFFEMSRYFYNINEELFKEIVKKDYKISTGGGKYPFYSFYERFENYVMYFKIQKNVNIYAYSQQYYNKKTPPNASDLNKILRILFDTYLKEGEISKDVRDSFHIAIRESTPAKTKFNSEITEQENIEELEYDMIDSPFLRESTDYLKLHITRDGFKLLDNDVEKDIILGNDLIFVSSNDEHTIFKEAEKTILHTAIIWYLTDDCSKLNKNWICEYKKNLDDDGDEIDDYCLVRIKNESMVDFLKGLDGYSIKGESLKKIKLVGGVKFKKENAYFIGMLPKIDVENVPLEKIMLKKGEIEISLSSLNLNNLEPRLDEGEYEIIIPQEYNYKNLKFDICGVKRNLDKNLQDKAGWFFSGDILINDYSRSDSNADLTGLMVKGEN